MCVGMFCSGTVVLACAVVIDGMLHHSNYGPAVLSCCRVCGAHLAVISAGDGSRGYVIQTVMQMMVMVNALMLMF